MMRYLLLGADLSSGFTFGRHTSAVGGDRQVPVVPGVRQTLKWEGDTDGGIPVAPGVYLLVLDTPQGTQIYDRGSTLRGAVDTAARGEP